MREHILAKFKGRLVIQLPQTIKFNDETSIARCADLIKAHKHFHLMVRDQQSLAFAQQHFECPTELVPDSAFALGAKKRPFQPVNDLFILLRTDVERATCDYSSFALVSGISGDWLDEPSNYYSYTKAKSALKAIIKGAWNKDRRRVIFYQQLATGRVERGLRLLSSGNRVITDPTAWSHPVNIIGYPTYCNGQQLRQSFWLYQCLVQKLSECASCSYARRSSGKARAFTKLTYVQNLMVILLKILG